MKCDLTTYDNVGNRTQLTSTLAPVPAATWSYDANDRFSADDSYDNNGNTTASGRDARPSRGDRAPLNGAFGRDGDTGKSADQALADFPSPPAGVLVLHIQNKVFHLERKLVGVAVRTAAPVGEPLNATFLIAIEDLVTVLREMPNSLQSSAIVSPASRRATNCSLSSIAEH